MSYLLPALSKDRKTSEQLDDEKVVEAINELGLIIMVNDEGKYEIFFKGKNGKIYDADYYPYGYLEGTEYHDVTIFRAASVQTWLKK